MPSRPHPSALCMAAAALIVAAGMTAPTSAALDAPPEAVLTPAAANPLTDTTPPGVLRSRPIAIDAPRLLAARAGDTLRLDLFDDAVLSAQVETITVPGADRLVISGTIAGDPFGRWLLVSRDGAVAASIQLPSSGELYRVRTGADAIGVVEQLDEAALSSCGTGPAHEVAHGNAPGGGGEGGVAGGDDGEGGVAGGLCDGGSQIDVIVAFTSVAASAAGGDVAVAADIELAIASANAAYTNSGVGMQVNLLLVTQVEYDELGSYGTHLQRLTNPGDGSMDALHELREQYNADMVALFVNDNEYCGLAWLMTNPSLGFASSAFSVTTWFCAPIVLAHELGHNMGCAHDHDNASQGAFIYSFGHRFNGDSGSLWRTVMAYAPGTRIPHFSSPLMLHDGQPTGVAQGEPQAADNARTLNMTAPIVANFRCSAPPNEIDTFDTEASFVAALAAGATTVEFSGVPSGQALLRPAGFEWNGLIAGADLLQVDANHGSTTGSPFQSDLLAATDAGEPIVLELPPGVDAVGGRWFHGEPASSGYTGAFTITLADGTELDLVALNLESGANQQQPEFRGFISACSDIERVSFTLGTPTTAAQALADRVIFGSTGYGCPPNDRCAEAITIGDGVVAFDNVNATTDGQSDVLCAAEGGSQIESDIWYRYVSPCTGPVTVSLCGSAFDTRLAVYPGFCPVVFNQAIACSDDDCGSGSELTFDAVSGESYRIRVGSADGQQGEGMLAITGPGCIPPPVNDGCGTALGVLEGQTPVDTAGATSAGASEGACGEGSDDMFLADLWYRFIAPCDGPVTVGLCDASFDGRVAIYGAPCPGGPDEAIACAAGGCGAGSASFDATAGTIYRFRVGSADGTTGTATLSVVCGPPPPLCAGDVDGNGTVNVDDMVAIIVAWGTADPAADLDDNGVVNVDDLVAVIVDWGCG